MRVILLTARILTDRVWKRELKNYMDDKRDYGVHQILNKSRDQEQLWSEPMPKLT